MKDRCDDNPTSGQSPATKPLEQRRSASPFVDDKAQNGSRRPKRILVVDDSRTMRMVLRRWLDRPDYQVVEAQNGDEALEKLRSVDFDLVTLDIDMPVLDGFGLSAQLRRMEEVNARPQTPIMMITSHDTIKDRERGFEVGATDFLAKPVNESEFIARIDRLLRTDDKLLGLTALVADDSRVARKSVAFSLARYGIKVLEAEDGVQAFQMLEAKPGEIDLLITDYDMPGMDGKELCRRVRTALGLPWLPVIILSALSDRERVLDLFASGATDYLCKPFTSEELAARLSVHMEIRRLSRERARQITELERLNGLKNNFLAIASHDLRSPLNGILGAAGVMLADPGLPKVHRDLAETINQSGEWLLQIVNDLLDLARIESEKVGGTQDIVDVAAVVAQACHSLRPIAAAKGIALVEERSEPGGPAAIHGIRNDIFRLITNIVSNAIKFTPAGGRVAVALERGADRKLNLSVTDSGIGIPADKLPQLFDRFSKLSRIGTAGELSTGLGMAIVKEIVDRHSGTITVTSQVGQGTSVVVTFPAAE